MVVDLAIENDPAGPVFIGDGLIASGTVDDRETSMAQHCTRIGKKSVSIRPTMRDRSRHRGNRFADSRG
jgi:hypothetical protein